MASEMGRYGATRGCLDPIIYQKTFLKIHVYTMEYYSAIKKNSFKSILMRWMKLEPIIQSEVSQKDKDHYNILTNIYGI